MDVGPPRIEIIDHELHHEVFGPVFLIIQLLDNPVLLIKALQDEAAGADAENGDPRVTEQFFEAEGFVEFFAEVEILGWEQGTRRFRAARNCHGGRLSRAASPAV